MKSYLRLILLFLSLILTSLSVSAKSNDNPIIIQHSLSNIVSSSRPNSVLDINGGMTIKKKHS